METGGGEWGRFLPHELLNTCVSNGVQLNGGRSSENQPPRKGGSRKAFANKEVQATNTVLSFCVTGAECNEDELSEMLMEL